MIKQPSRLIQSYLLPPTSRSRATVASLQWMAVVDTTHAMCVECFRLYVAEQCDEFLLLEESHELIKDKLEPGQVTPQRPRREQAAEKAGKGNDMHYALCRNDYCALARGKLWESVRKGLRPAVLSPESESDQVSGWLHTGMHVPNGGEREMFMVEQKRYPYLRVHESGVPDSGRGVFYCGERPLQANEVVCTLLGQIRAMLAYHCDADHPLSFDLSGLYNDSCNPNHEYGLRIFQHTFGAIINSAFHTAGVTANCKFALHPHFAHQQDYYVGQAVYPSGTYCVIVLDDCTIEPGQELFIDYDWQKTRLHTRNLQ